jgi:hypothetical protein
MSSLTQSGLREAAAERLAQHAAGGSISLDDYAARALTLTEATTSGGVEAALEGLPARTAASGARQRRWLVSLFGGSQQRGLWRLGSQLRIVSLFGGINIDLGHAQVEAPDVVIAIIAVAGGAGIIAPSGVPVTLSGLSLFGRKSDKRTVTPPLPGSPLIRVRTLVLFGAVSITDRRSRTVTVHSLLHRVRRRSCKTARA